MTAGDLDSPLLGRLVRPADYVRVLATPLRLRSPHFAVHHLEGRPLPSKRPMPRASDAPVTASLSTELSTDRRSHESTDVDDSPRDDQARTSDAGRPGAECADAASRGPQRWLGLVVPKRNAKRAVTRTLMKRQIRHIANDCAARLEPGLWVVRQRSPFDPKQFPSAASDALKEAARTELRALFERAMNGERDRVKPRDPVPAGGRASAADKRRTKPKAAPAQGSSCAR